MKILDIPKSGKCGQVVAFQSRYGFCLRQLVSPRNTITPARQFMRRAFGRHSQGYSRKLGEEQRHRWILAGAQVMSDPRLGQNGPAILILGPVGSLREQGGGVDGMFG